MRVSPIDGSQRFDFGYADSPYYGCCSYYGHNHNEGGSRPFDGKCWNDIETHALLFEYMRATYPDGWAASLTSPSLVILAQHLIPGERIAAWVKPFASFKPGINPGYCWEPVIFSGGRKRDRTEDTVKDFVSESITLKKGLAGAKPFKFCLWILDLLGYRAPIDTLTDVFPGTGVMSKALAYRCGVPMEQLSLEAS